MQKNDLWLCRLSVLALVIFYATLVCALFIPVYYDDIGVLISRSRSGYDDWQSITSQKLCLSDLAVSIPWLIAPGRTLAWLAHIPISNLMILRLMSMGIFIIWLALFYWLVKNIFLPQLSQLFAAALVSAAAGIGMMPWGMVQGRPEPAILTCITFFIALPFIIQRHRVFFVRYLWIIAAAFWLLLSYFFSLHSKNVTYAPLALAALCYLPFRQQWQRISMLALSSATLWQSITYTMDKLVCTGSNGIEDFRAAQALQPHQLLQPLSFVESFARNLLHFGYYINHLLFNPTQKWTTRFYEHKWWLDEANSLLGMTAMVIIILALSGALWCFYCTIKTRQWRLPQNSMLLALALGLMLQSGIQITKVFYESSLIWGCMILLVGLSFMQTPWPSWLSRKGNYALTALMGISILSQISLATAYMPITLDIVSHPPQDGLLLGSHHLSSPISSAQIGENTLKLAQACHITPDSSSRFVIVDSSTYFAMRKTYMPLYQPFYRPPTGQDNFYRALVNMSGQIPSSGLITSCQNLPAYIKPYTTKSDGLCCLRKDQMIPDILLPGDQNDTQ